jgi:hypothetical protein
MSPLPRNFLLRIRLSLQFQNVQSKNSVLKIIFLLSFYLRKVDVAFKIIYD